MKVLLVILVASILGVQAREHYTIENIPLPDDEDLNGQIDGLTFLPDGRLAACFPFGKVYLRDPDTGNWTMFAEGLHNPLGIVAIDDRTLVVGQRPEITRLVDEDGDGVADLYETLCDGFGMSGNYHEFHFGPVMDAEGNFYSALGTASGREGRFWVTGKGIRSMRKKLGLTQVELAKLIGVSGQAVYQWEAQDGTIKVRSKAREGIIKARQLSGSREAKRALEAM